MIHQAEKLDDNLPECFREFVEVNENSGERETFKLSMALIIQDYSDQEVDNSGGKTITELAKELKVGEQFDTTCGYNIIRTK